MYTSFLCPTLTNKDRAPGEKQGLGIGWIGIELAFCGSTSGVAQHIAHALCRQGAKTDVKKIDNIGNISQYDGIVVGSAVKSGSWYPEAIDFVKENKKVLSTVPVAYFLTCLALYHDHEKTGNP